MSLINYILVTSVQISGKGENIWDRLVHTHPELINDGTNGDIACDSYHKYKEDIALAKNLNVYTIALSIIN